MKLGIITLLAKPSANREQFIRSLQTAELNFVVAEEISEALNSFERNGSNALVHVLENFERNDVALFHHRFVRTRLGGKIARFIVYRGTNERAACFAQDLGMIKGIQAELSHSTLGYTVKILLQGYYNLEPDLREAIELSASSDCYVQQTDLENWRILAQRFPNNDILKISIARAELFQTGAIENALNVGQKILQLNPFHIRAMSLVGDARLASNDLPGAAKILAAAESFAGGNPARIASIGHIAALLGNLETAKKCILRSVEICPIVGALQPVLKLINFTADERKTLSESLSSRLSADEIASLFS